VIRSGVVSAVDSPHLVTVQLDPAAGCGNCARAGGCGIRLLGTTPSPVSINCDIPKTQPCLVGDRVQVRLSMPAQNWLKLVALAYGLPTLGMIAGTAGGGELARFLSMSDYHALFSLIGFAGGLAGGLFAWRKLDKPLQNKLPVHGQAEHGQIIPGTLN